jgi:hypothetical protein
MVGYRLASALLAFAVAPIATVTPSPSRSSPTAVAIATATPTPPPVAPWSVKKEVDLVEVGKVVVGIVAALWFQQILQRRFSTEAKIRDLLIKRIENAEKRLAKLERIAGELKVGERISVEQQRTITPLFKALYMAVGDIEKSLKTAGFGEAYGDELKSFVREMMAYKQSLTGRPPLTPLDAADLAGFDRLHLALSSSLTTVSIRVLEQGKAKRVRWYRWFLT